MPIYEYILLAMLTSGNQGQEGITLTLGPDAIAQPTGGVQPNNNGLIVLTKGLNTEGIKGESQDTEHKGEIDINSKHTPSNQSKIKSQNNQYKQNMQLK